MSESARDRRRPPRLQGDFAAVENARPLVARGPPPDNDCFSQRNALILLGHPKYTEMDLRDWFLKCMNDCSLTY